MILERTSKKHCLNSIRKFTPFELALAGGHIRKINASVAIAIAVTEAVKIAVVALWWHLQLFSLFRLTLDVSGGRTEGKTPHGNTGSI